MRRPSAALALAALLYGAMALAANTAIALTPAERAELMEMRTGEMARLAIRDDPMPRVEESFRDLYGNRVTLADYAGKVVLVNFWATWCAPCRHEMPAIDRLAGALEGPDFAVIPMSLDRAGVETAQDFLDRILVQNLEVMHDRSGDFRRMSGVPGLPVTLILDREGREIARLIGPAEWDSPEARALIRRIIEMTRPAAKEVRT